MPEPIQNEEKNVGSSQPPQATTYGELLRLTRENKGLSVDQVASQLRISNQQIEGLENNDYKVFPTPVYARAHLRSYARLLGLDDNQVTDLFNASLQPEDRDPRSFIRKTTQDLAPYQDVQPKNYFGKFIAGLIFLAVLITVGYFGYTYYLERSGESAPLAPAASAEGSASVATVSEGVRDNSKNEVSAEKEKAAKNASSASSASNAQDDQAFAVAAVKTVSSAAVANNTAIANNATDADKLNTLKADEQSQQLKEAEMKARLQKEAEEKIRAKAEEERLAAEAKAKAALEAKTPVVEDTSTPAVLVHNPEGNWELPISVAAGTAVPVQISATSAECWYGIYKDNKLVYNTQLKPGQSKDYSMQPPFKVSVGNRLAGAVRINGRAVDLDNKTNHTSTVFTVISK